MIAWTKRDPGQVQLASRTAPLMPEILILTWRNSILAPLAKGQRAVVMVLCPPCVRSSVCASINSAFK